MFLLEYLYADADNYKARGRFALSGDLTDGELHRIRSHFERDDLFIAEQLGVPPLYDQLGALSGGPTRADQCWHTYLRLSSVPSSEVPSDALPAGDAQDFLRKLLSVTEWQEDLSPHFAIGVERLRRLASAGVGARDS
ncbi:MAG TPA: hypothetical protein VHM92_06560 [Allosphingosinicella sp.]|nr:hypothetical protein [Allosphingosinicella sp.]